MKHALKSTVICIVGLGYVGLPLALAFARKLKVIGFDVDDSKVKSLHKNNNRGDLIFTHSPEDVRQADFIFICVPTPVNKGRKPDLSSIKEASRVIGQNMARDSVVILESTVYPGLTEEVVVPVLEKASGLKCGQDFKIAYSPERINPGDDEHSLEKVTKVVAGMDDETARLVVDLYKTIVRQVFVAKDIKTAEAAKLVENIQRDVNIALINELSMIFGKMGLDTRAVLDAAGTKWNFHRYSPGLVGGHCIPVVPHYMVYKAKKYGYNAGLIRAGRAVNDSVPDYVAELMLQSLKRAGKFREKARVLVMGLAYKEDVPDTKESPALEIVRRLEQSGVKVYCFDPLLDKLKGSNTIKMTSFETMPRMDGIIITVAHKAFSAISLAKLKAKANTKPVLIDIRGMYDPSEAAGLGFDYHRL